MQLMIMMVLKQRMMTMRMKMMAGTVLLVMVQSLDSGVEQSNRGGGFEDDKDCDRGVRYPI